MYEGDVQIRVYNNNLEKGHPMKGTNLIMLLLLLLLLLLFIVEMMVQARLEV